MNKKYLFIDFLPRLCYYIKNCGVEYMDVSFKKLWKLLIDRNMKKKDLRTAAEISPATLAKLGRDEHVNTRILCKICGVLKCDISDIMEIKATNMTVNSKE